MATLADIIVTLTLDTSEFTKNLKQAESEIKNFSQSVNQSTKSLNKGMNSNLLLTAKTLKAFSKVTGDAGKDFGKDTTDMKSNLKDLSRASKYMARNLGTSVEDAKKVLEAGTAEFERFGSMGNRVSHEIKDEFMGLPKHLQLYVQRLREAGESTEEFTKLAEKYGARRIEKMREENDFLQSKTTQSEKLLKSFAENTNLAPVSRQFLNLGRDLEKTAKRGSALNLALKRVGDNPSLKNLRDETKLISQGVMRARGALIGFGIAGGLALYGMIKLATAVDERVVPAFENLKSTWNDAMMPFTKAFATGLVAVMKFVTAIGEMVQKFSEAHPVIFNMIMSILLLTLVLGALLSPLAVTGIWAEGLAASFAVLWATIGQFVLGMLAVVGVALAVATAIVVLFVAIQNLWKESAKFRKAFTTMWDDIKKAVIDNFVKPVKKSWEGLTKSFSGMITTITGKAGTMANLWEWLGDKISVVVNLLARVAVPLLSLAFEGLGLVVSGAIDLIAFAIDSLSPAIKTMQKFSDSLKKAFDTKDFSGMGEGFAGLIELILTTLIGGIPKLITMGAKLIESLAKGMGLTVPELIQLPFTIITDLINSFLSQLPMVIEIGGKVIQGLVDGLIQALPVVLEALVALVNSIVTTLTTVITEYLPVVLEAGLSVLNALIDGIVTNLPIIMDAIIAVLTAVITAIVDNLPMIIDAGIQLLTALIEGILATLPVVIDAILNILMTVIDVIATNLPMIIDAGIKILMALIDGIVKILPKLIDAIIMLIDKVVGAIVDNLPKIIDSGIKILLALIEGIIDVLPKLIECVMKLILSIVTAIIENLPKIIEAGIKIIIALVAGLIQAIPQLLAAIPQIVTAIFNAFAEVEWAEIGKNIMAGIGAGLTKAKEAVFGTVSNIASGLLAKAQAVLGIHSPSKEFAKNVGRWIPEGIAVGVEAYSKVPVKAVGETSEDVLKNGSFKGRSIEFPSLDFSKNSNEQKPSYTSNDQYVIHATVREDADIQRIIDELEKRKRQSERAKGVFSY